MGIFLSSNGACQAVIQLIYLEFRVIRIKHWRPASRDIDGHYVGWVRHKNQYRICNMYVNCSAFWYRITISSYLDAQTALAQFVSRFYGLDGLHESEINEIELVMLMLL